MSIAPDRESKERLCSYLLTHHMHRYETALKANPEFKKHVSWFTSATDGSLHATALYEYFGTYDLSASENVMTNPKVIDKLKTDTRKPKQMYTDMNLNNSLEAPKNTIDLCGNVCEEGVVGSV
jgi:hypothetical protein